MYFDITYEKREIGRVVFELDAGAAGSAERFAQFAQNGQLNGTQIGKIIKNFMVLASTDLDLGCETENTGEINSSFFLCVSNAKPFSFFVTVESSPHLNNKHTILGKVKYGKSVIRYIERIPVESNKQSEANAWIPSSPVVISQAGIWTQDMSLPNSIACTDTVGGKDVYEEYPDDNEPIEGVNFDEPEISFKVIETIKSCATVLLKAGKLDQSLMKYQKAVRYCNELLPDNHNNKEWHDKFLNMKMTLFLNITLVALQMKSYKLCKDYCQFIFDMEGVEMNETQVSKVFYRLSKAQMGLNLPEEALETLQKAHVVLPNDKIIEKELQSVQQLALDAKKQQREKYAKFLS